MLGNILNPFDINVYSTMSSEVQTIQSAMTLDKPQSPARQISKFYLTGFQFDNTTSEFLDLNVDVALKIPEIVSKVNDTVGVELSPQFELMTDEETGEVNGVMLLYKIHNKTYEEILDLWDKVSDEVYKNVDVETSKKISIILNGE